MADAVSYDAIYLSPHLDDVALSCGGQVAKRVRAGERVLVATLFTADEPPAPRSPLAETLHRYFGLDSGVVAARREEDRASMGRLEVELWHAGELEGIYRVHPQTGEPLYPDIKRLFGEMCSADLTTLSRLEKRLHELPPARAIVAPLAIGRHVDHALVRVAAETVFGARLEHYEDFPYVERWLALRRALGFGGGWSSRSVELGEGDLDIKVEAIAAYASQLKPLFGERAALDRRVRQYARKVGGERLWKRNH